MRGTRRSAVCLRLPFGIIPADAGNTPNPPVIRSSSKDHPRGCGEHAPQTTPYQDWSGSSPRMRGTPSTASCMTSGSGIIPADAGNTKYQLFCTRPREDHPRGCGEHYHNCFASLRHWGSSPRMRGTRPSFIHGAEPTRIIPADAGNTPSLFRLLRLKRDHPRGCGEHLFNLEAGDGAAGSSPRMRGTRGADAALAPVGGIIPADAGNTSARDSRRVGIKDHPRGCGEHGADALRRNCHSGSSPRMRGTPHAVRTVETAKRIIPADAGNTIGCIPISRQREDHPRGCGEHWSDNPVVRFAPGSSPRMRGTQYTR